MNDALRQISRLDAGVGEALALFGDLADVDGRFGTELHTAEAADAVAAEAGLAADKLDVSCSQV